MPLPKPIEQMSTEELRSALQDRWDYDLLQADRDRLRRLADAARTWLMVQEWHDLIFEQLNENEKTQANLVYLAAMLQWRQLDDDDQGREFLRMINFEEMDHQAEGIGFDALQRVKDTFTAIHDGHMPQAEWFLEALKGGTA